MNNFESIIRRKSTRIYVRKIPIGNVVPILVQFMTNIYTINIVKKVKQINNLKKAGADIVRVSIPDMDSVESLKKIRQQIIDVSLIADIHFDYRIALKSAEYGADCLRINPDNIGNKNRIKSVINCVQDKGISIRISVNVGSIECDLQNKYLDKSIEYILLESAMRHIDILDKLNFHQFKASIKSSDVSVAIKPYQLLASKIDQPLHIGLTESVSLRNETIKSPIPLSFLLLKGIGDTIHVLDTDPIEEVKMTFGILRSLKIRNRGINFIACQDALDKNLM